MKKQRLDGLWKSQVNILADCIAIFGATDELDKERNNLREGTMDYLTCNQIIELEKTGHAVHLYPIKHIVSVDGYKKYKVSGGTIDKYNYCKKHSVKL